VCTVAPGTTAVHPWMPEMPVVTCTPRPGSDSSDDEELPAQAGTSVVRPELEGGS
jgi:hypothetical protein